MAQMVEACPPSFNVNLPSVPSFSHPLGSIVELWKWESTRLVSNDFSQCYESQRDLFFLLHNSCIKMSE